VIAAVALHLGLFALLVFVPSKPSLLPVGSSVPINIVSSAQFTDTRPAVQAPETQTAAAPTPTPQGSPQPPAAELAPPQFGPTASQSTKPAATQPSTHAAPSSASVDWSKMQQIIENARRSTGAQASSAARGQARAETAPQARPDAGQGLSMSDQLGLQQLLERLWNPNCDAPGGSSVKLQVKFIVGLSGRLLGAPNAGGQESSSDHVMAAAARRALDAVREAEPYGQPYYGQTITVNFDAKEACAKR
jgi:outer membrane biosynthesis protein TonB